MREETTKETIEKKIIDDIQKGKKIIHKATEPDLADQYKNVLSNTKDAAVKYAEDTAPKVIKTASDAKKTVSGFLNDKGPKVTKSISDAVKSSGEFIKNKSNEYFPSSAGSIIGKHVGDNVGLYGAAATGLGAYALYKYLKNRKKDNA